MPPLSPGRPVWPHSAPAWRLVVQFPLCLRSQGRRPSPGASGTAGLGGGPPGSPSPTSRLDPPILISPQTSGSRGAGSAAQRLGLQKGGRGSVVRCSRETLGQVKGSLQPTWPPKPAEPRPFPISSRSVWLPWGPAWPGPRPSVSVADCRSEEDVPLCRSLSVRGRADAPAFGAVGPLG